MRFIAVIVVSILSFSGLCAQQAELELADKYNITSDSFGALSNYKNAVLYRKKALNIYQNMQPVPFEEVVDCFRTLGLYYRRAANFTEAEYYQKRAVELAEAKLGPDNLGTLKAYNSYGAHLLVKGEYSRSLEFFNKALAISQRMGYTETGNQFNNIGIVYENMGDYEAALDFYKKALAYNLKNSGKISEKASDNFFNLGTLSYNMGQLDAALAYFDTTLFIYDSILPAHSLDFAGLYNNMGAVYNSKGDYKKGIGFLDKSLALYEKLLGSNHPEVSNTYANTGIVLLERGDLDKALAYFQKAYTIRRNNFGPNHASVARSCVYLGNTFLEKKDFDQAYHWLNKGLQTLLILPEIPPSEIAEVRNDLGLYFEKMGDYAEALRQYNQALSTNERKLDKNDPDVANSFARIGNVYLAKKQYGQAIAHFNKALSIRLKVYGKIHPEVADTYRQLALSYPTDEACAFEYCEAAYTAINYLPTGAGPFEKAISPIQLLKTLQTEGSLHQSFYDQTTSLDHLEKADLVYQTGYKLIDFIKNKLEEPGSRQALQDNFFLVYEEGIHVKSQLKEATGKSKYWEEAFDIAERSNATLLLDAIRTVQAERFSDIPDSLLAKERQLKIDLAFYEKQRFEEEFNGPAADQKKIGAYNDKIFSLKNKYQELMAIFRRDFPDYFSLKYVSKTETVRSVKQNLLKGQQTMLAYFVGETNVYAFVISRTGFDMVSIKKDFPLEAWVEEFRNSISRFNPANKEVDYLNQKYANIGYELYQLIIKPVEPYLHSSELVIVPGGVLGYLPFDALLASPAEDYGDFYNHDYLLNKYQISYAYSATLLQEMLAQRNSRGRFLAFAPTYSGDTLEIRSDPWRAILGNLKYNMHEARAIHHIMGGDVYLDSLATKGKFLETAPLANIIHLAAHGKSNDRHGEYSYLAFYQKQDTSSSELLFVKNLYNLRIGADLVVLSACETGIGEMQRGEGIVSLARGFSFAGASSIITTLWSIDDQASAEIMVSFYSLLKKGSPKDAALREAKLSYLSNKKGSNRAHPLFWAAFVPVGNMEPLDEWNWPWWAWMLAVCIGGAGVFLLGSQAMKRRASKLSGISLN